MGGVSLPVEVVCAPGVATGFSLAGIVPRVARDAAQARAALAAAGEAGAGVVLIEEGLWQALGAEVRRRSSRQGLPLVVPFPAPALAAPAGRGGGAYLVEILRQAIGYRVRLS
jgi:vacuolar-type H+-ATPase subunit F/Vma7